MQVALLFLAVWWVWMYTADRRRPLACGVATTCVFAVVAVWETIALSTKRQPHAD